MLSFNLYNMKKLLIILVFASFQTLFSQTQVFKTKVKFENVDNIVSPIGDSVRIPILNEAGVMQSLPKYLIITQAQQDWIKSQMYTNHSATFTVSPSSGERGVDTSITVNYNISSNDDEITSASINQGIGSVLSDVDTGAKTVSGGTTAESKSWQLSIGYTRNGTPGSQNRTATYTATNPKWQGVSSSVSDVTVDSYTDLTAGNGFTKFISASGSMTINLNNNTGQYVWFISTQNVNKITASGFDTTIGDWDDEGAFFWKKSIPGFKLANGTTTATMYVYRTRELQNTGGATIPFVFNP